tara:strand:- start:464 stop:757 length:294 start_codon:yes stop_codon:yes gene_type:complete
MSSNISVPKTDLKKKPTYEMLKCIAKQSNSDICPHPFEKAKKKKEHKLEEIFDKRSSKINKGSKNKHSNLKKISKSVKKTERKIKDNKIKSVKKKSI